VIDAISFVVFFAVIYWRSQKLIDRETESTSSLESNWATALRDRRLLVCVLVNIIF